MIKVTRFNGKEYVINAELIEFIEETPDTVISLTTGRKVIVKEKIDELLAKIVEYRQKVHSIPSHKLATGTNEGGKVEPGELGNFDEINGTSEKDDQT